MKIAIATKDFAVVSGHAGQCRQWLVYDLGRHRPGQLLPAPQRVALGADEVLHVFADDRAHPLDGVDLAVVASAGDGFIRHMRQRGCEVLVTGEPDPAVALTRIVAGEAAPASGTASFVFTRSAKTGLGAAADGRITSAEKT